MLPILTQRDAPPRNITKNRMQFDSARQHQVHLTNIPWQDVSQKASV